ncbi:hypothetical protein GXW82_20290 [Streptacidiphilus sp. 4-A2]|nr:hypothetical protein [Streptacidiphilus sp. 4-A2]
MNTRGEHRAAEPGVRSRTPRTAVLLLALAVAAVGATWGEVHYARSAQVNRAGGDNGSVSQESVGTDGAGSGGTVQEVAALRLNDVLPAAVSEPPTPPARTPTRPPATAAAAAPTATRRSPRARPPPRPPAAPAT